MFTATDLSILILIIASILVLILDAIGSKQSKLGLLEKPHIGLVAFGSLYISLIIVLLESFAVTSKNEILFHSAIGSVFLVINSIISIFIMRNVSIKKPSGSIYFLILSSLAISMYSISTDSLIFKFIASSGWMVLLTTLTILSTQGGRKAEIGLKFSFSTLMLIIQFILLISILYYENLSLNITDIDLTSVSEISQSLITIFMILSGMAMAGIPPFHSGFIDCIDGGIGAAFLLLSNASIQGCSLLIFSQHLINNSSLPVTKFNTFGLILVIGFIILWARALDQSKIRRTTAYIAASIAPLFSMSLLFGSSVLLPKPIFIVATYAFITLSLSALFSSLSHMSPINQPWQTWEDLSGFGRMNPWQTLVFLVGLSSIAGIPGTFGYFIKLSLIAPMQENLIFSSSIFLSIAIGAACLMRVFVFVFSKHSHVEQNYNLPRPSLWLVALSVILIGLGFFPFVS